MFRSKFLSATALGGVGVSLVGGVGGFASNVAFDSATKADSKFESSWRLFSGNIGFDIRDCNWIRKDDSRFNSVEGRGDILCCELADKMQELRGKGCSLAVTRAYDYEKILFKQFKRTNGSFKPGDFEWFYEPKFDVEVAGDLFKLEDGTELWVLAMRKRGDVKSMRTRVIRIGK